MFGFDEVIEDVRFAFTDRYGGVSQAPYAELNLGSASGDNVQAVAENVRRVAHEFGVGHGALIRVSQVHGADVHQVGPDADLAFGSPMATADAMVTTRTDVALCIDRKSVV